MAAYKRLTMFFSFIFCVCTICETSFYDGNLRSHCLKDTHLSHEIPQFRKISMSFMYNEKKANKMFEASLTMSFPSTEYIVVDYIEEESRERKKRTFCCLINLISYETRWTDHRFNSKLPSVCLVSFLMQFGFFFCSTATNFMDKEILSQRRTSGHEKHDRYFEVC